MPADNPKRDGAVALDATELAHTRETAAGGDDTSPAAPPGPTLPAGTLVGRYRIEACLGAGGMGIVYRARDTELDRPVALKLVRPQANAEELTERLRRESRLQTRAAHRSVITVFDIGRDRDQVFVAMELIEGATLRAWLAMRPRSWREILDVFQRAGDGLAAAHAAGLVHRDFKPDNVLVELRADRVTRVLVTDFGVARAVEGTDLPSGRRSAPTVNMTATGALIGTPAYMSPEQLDAEPADERADIFSFCVALWEALFKQRPFPGTNIAEIIHAFERPPEAPPRSSVPGWLTSALRRGLAIDREQRTPSMLRLSDSLDWRRRRRTRIAVLAGAVVVLGIAGGVAAATVAGTEAAPSACSLPSRLGDDIVRAGDALADILAGQSREYADYWRTSTASYARNWNRLRATACAAWSEDQVGCVDRLAAEYRAILDGARTSDAVRRGDILRANIATPAPHECLSASAAELTAAVSLAQPALAARRALDAAGGAWWRAPDDSRRQFIALRPLVAVAQHEPLQREADFATLRFREERAADRVALQREAQAADRAGDYALAAQLWTDTAIGIDRDAETLLAADNSLIRAGNPPRLRAWFHLLQAAGRASSDRPSAVAELARARNVLERGEVPYDVFYAHARAQVLIRMGSYEEAAREMLRAKEFATWIDMGGPALISMRADLARALAWSNRIAEASAEIDQILAGIDPQRALPAYDLASVIHVYVQIAAWSDPAEALRRLERWSPAIEATLGRDSIWRGRLEALRATSLANLGRFSDAERSARQALEAEVANVGPTSGNAAEQRILLGQILLELDRSAEAEELLRRGVTDLAHAVGEDMPRLAQARHVLADHLLATHRHAEALPFAEQALRVYESSSEFAAPSRAALRWLLAQAIAGATPDPARERTLIEQALAEWGPHPAGHEAELSAARARLRELSRRP